VKQSTRLSVFAVLILALAVIGVGGVSVSQSYSAQVNSSADVLATGVAKIAASGGTLTSAIAYADSASVPISVGLSAFDNTVSAVRDTDIELSPSYSVATLDSAVTHAVVIEGNVPYQLRAFKTVNAEYVLLAISLVNARHALDRDLLVLVITSILAISLGGALVFWVSRRNLKQMVVALSNSAEHERETRRAMQNFMGDASHELRTPLTVIKGYSELLAQDGAGDAETRAKAYTRIVEQVNRMDETIASLLELAEVGSVSANSFAPVDLAALVSGAADDLKAMSPTREIKVSVAPCTVQGSAALLGKLLANAIGNIARHAGQKAAVNISLKVVKKNAVLVIEDGGKGLPDEAYARGVQAFRRFDPSRSRDTGGTGLGMSIMNSIVEAHSGVFGISKSRLGGLRLEIQLPLN
jgi:signal transduction histidine kinase